MELARVYTAGDRIVASITCERNTVTVYFGKCEVIKALLLDMFYEPKKYTFAFQIQFGDKFSRKFVVNGGCVEYTLNVLSMKSSC